MSTDPNTASGTEPGYVRPDVTLIGEEHIRRYEETGGAVGQDWNGATCLVLTAQGRKTGKPRKFALIYARDGENYLLVASKGGAPTHPGWYLNLLAHPDAEVQVLDRRFSVRARTAGPEERPRLWEIVNQKWPNYEVYTTRTTREIPVVVLEPT